MRVIEIEIQVKNGIIKIPEKFKNLENAYLKIKIQPCRVKAENNRTLKIKHLLEIIIRKNIFKKIASPEDWQRNLRNDRKKGIAG